MTMPSKPGVSGGGRAEAQAEPAVGAPLLLNLGDVDLADLLRFADMGAATGLGIDRAILADGHDTDTARSARRPDVGRLHETRIGVELLVGDPAREHLVIVGDEPGERLRDLVLVGVGLRHIEVETALVLADRRAGDRERADDGQEMERGVHTHHLVATRPVDVEDDGVPDCRDIALAEMQDDLRTVLAVARVDDRDLPPVGPFDRAGVAGLAAARRIEVAAIDDDAALALVRDDARLQRREIGVVEVGGLGAGHDQTAS
jgi:hypothetical protein